MINFGKVAFITESNFSGKYPSNFTNARTEIAWQIALNATHYPFKQYINVEDYDHVFIILPKGKVFLNAEGSRIAVGENPISPLFYSGFIHKVKEKNKQVHFIQEGPNWWPQDYSVRDQFNWYSTVAEFDSIFCHNESDKGFYEGMFPDKPVNVIPSLMIEELIKNFTHVPSDKVMVGGNFSRFYGGFNSYIISNVFEDCSKYTMDSHSKREDEHLVDGLTHFPRITWVDWMVELSKFKYAVHLMPTVAAGTFSLNCAYFGIPCIGNYKMDTQKKLFPELSVDVEDLKTARHLAEKLRDDSDFYADCSEYAKSHYKKYFNIDVWRQRIFNSLNYGK